MVWLAIRIQNPFPVNHILNRPGKSRLTVRQAGMDALIGIEQVSFWIVPFCTFGSRFLLQAFDHLSYILTDRDLQERDPGFCDLAAQIGNVFSLFFVPDIIQTVIIPEVQDIRASPSGFPEQDIQRLHLFRLNRRYVCVQLYTDRFRDIFDFLKSIFRTFPFGNVIIENQPVYVLLRCFRIFCHLYIIKKLPDERYRLAGIRGVIVLICFRDPLQILFDIKPVQFS